MKRNEAYYQACTARKVPVSVLAQVYEEIKDKNPEEQDSIREEWAKRIEAEYPYKPGREPKQETVT